MRNTQISPSFPLESQAFPNDLQALQDSNNCPRSVYFRVFKSPLECPKFQLLYHVKIVKTCSCIILLAGARPERAHGHGMGTVGAHGHQMGAENAQGAPTGSGWAPIMLFNSHASFAPFIHPLDSFFLLYLSTSS